MQQETPQVNQPAPQPQVPPVAPPPEPEKPDSHGADFYQPAAPLAFSGTAHAAPSHQAVLPSQQPFTWEASEYVHVDKGGMWLVGLGVVTVVALGFAIWLAAWTFVALILVMALAMGVFAFRRPHVLRYTLDDDGIAVGDKTFHYTDFRAFGILEDGAFFTMTLIPLKRFSPAVNVYFAEEQGEHIVDIVGSHLPMEEVHLDLIDDIMRRLHF